MNRSAQAAYLTSVAMAEQVVETPTDLAQAAEAHGLAHETVWHLGQWRTFVVPTACPHQHRMSVYAPAGVAVMAQLFADKIAQCERCAAAPQER
jgi:hypothetical protein